MKKIFASLAVALTIATPAMAHGHGYYSPWVPFGAGVIIGNVLTQRPTYVYQQVPPPQVIYTQPQTVYVYPSNAPVIQAPGQTCELRSENDKGVERIYNTGEIDCI